MAFEGPLEDRIAIRELIESYADAVFQRDETAWAATWAEKSTWNLGGMEVEGRANIVALWRQAMAGFPFAAFVAMPGAIQVNGERATARVYATEVLGLPDGKTRRIIGQYDDTLVKENGHWLFQRRAYQILKDTTSET